ncbi:MAG: hypothetical protein E7163_00760 [Firmicutes bacterium]|nr:hypothetical protein [Bacillota bacterium]
MFILKLLLKIEGTKGVDAFLNNNYDYLYGLNAEKLKKFFISYLNTPFDCSKKQYFEIYRYIKSRPIIDDEILTNSIYFKTMPNELVIDALKEIQIISGFYQNFINGLIKRIRVEDKDRIKKIPSLIIAENNEAICNKLIEFKDMDLIISLIKENIITPRDISDKLTKNFSVEEYKKIALNFDYMFLMDDIMEDLYFQDKYDDILDLLFKYKKIHPEDEQVYWEFAYIFTDFIEIPEEFEQAIIDTNDKELMYAWITNTKGSLKEDIIEKLMADKTYLIRMLMNLDKRYVLFIIDKIKENPEIYNIDNLINIICSNANSENIERIDYLISCFRSYDLDSDFSKENSVLLISLNSRFSREIIGNSNFDELERKNILDSLNKSNRTDLLTIYGSYLISGDKAKLVEDEQIRKFNEPLERVRKNNNN